MGLATDDSGSAEPPGQSADRGGAVVIVPVKRLRAAKSRLRAELGRRTPELVLAMAGDVIDAAVRCRGITDVVVITDDAAVRAMALGAGASVMPDKPSLGLNPALRWASAQIRCARPGALIITQPADCPAVDHVGFELLVAELRRRDRRVYVIDRIGTGTTSLGAPAGAHLDPRYGSNSAASHRESGAIPLVGPEWLRLSHDVDTLTDLRAARMLGVGPRTAGWLDRYPLDPASSAP